MNHPYHLEKVEVLTEVVKTLSPNAVPKTSNLRTYHVTSSPRASPTRARLSSDRPSPSRGNTGDSKGWILNTAPQELFERIRQRVDGGIHTLLQDT